MSRALPHAAAVLLVLVLALASAAPALAHADLVASDPDDGAVLAEPPAAVTLRFSEALDAGKSSFRLVGPLGEVGRAEPSRDSAKVMRLEGLSLAAGAYTIRWTAGSGDGHVERGTLGFTVLEPTPAPATPSPGPTQSAVPAGSSAATASPAAPPESTSAAPATPTPSVTGGDQVPAAASGGDVLIPIVAALALVAGIGALVLRRSRRA